MVITHQLWLPEDYQKYGKIKDIILWTEIKLLYQITKIFFFFTL